MRTFCLKLQFHRRSDIGELLGKVKFMEQKAVNWMLKNNKTSLSSVHEALYYPFRHQFPDLHSQWVIWETLVGRRLTARKVVLGMMR